MSNGRLTTMDRSYKLLFLIPDHVMFNGGNRKKIRKYIENFYECCCNILNYEHKLKNGTISEGKSEIIHVKRKMLTFMFYLLDISEKLYKDTPYNLSEIFIPSVLMMEYNIVSLRNEFAKLKDAMRQVKMFLSVYGY